MKGICIVPHMEGPGGMASFRLKFEQGLEKRGISFTHDLAQPAQALLVIAGTRNLPGVWASRRRGVRVVQRLDGINWVQRVRRTGLRYHLRAEYGNALLAFIRRRLADRVIYQSRFIRGWWEDWYGRPQVPAQVIVNAVDLMQYSPEGPEERPSDRYRMMLLEGSLAGGLNNGLFHALRLAEEMNAQFPMELVVVGRVDAATQKQVKAESRIPVEFRGVVRREQVPGLARASHLLYCAEINPPCPNSVIEAMACGLPVAGFDSGALTELVQGDAGRIVPYGADPWKLERPDIPVLARAAAEILEDQPRFRRAARERAEAEFGVDRMVEAYLKVLLED